MSLTRRLVVGAVLVVGLLVALVLSVPVRQAREALLAANAREALMLARAVAANWADHDDPVAASRVSGVPSTHRVTLLDSAGRPLAIASHAPGDPIATPAIPADRPELRAARDSGVGVSWSEAGLGREVRVALRTPAGYVHVAAEAVDTEATVARLRRNVYLAGLAVLAGAALLAVWIGTLARRPLHELRDVTRALASGDFSRRPALVAPGEVGDLASAIYRLAEQLTGRVEALTAEEALLRAIMESLNEGVVAVDERGQVVRINHKARQLFAAYDATPFPSERLSRDRALREALAGALRGASTDGVELAVLDRTMVIAARPLRTGGAVLAAYDLTRQRQLETVRRDFVANVSHELKTPLTIIGGFAETLTADDTPPAVRKQFAESIANNTRRMQRIVDDLLDLSRIESGGWMPRAARVEVSPVASEAFAAVATRAEHAEVELRLDVAPDAPCVWADPTALRQILDNLVENAVRHTAGGSVTVFTRRTSQGVTLGVRDTGSGIPAEHLPRIFERFYRVDAARSREAGGTGLGLAIVRHLVEAHGGQLRAESAVGRGTTITAVFPESGGDAARPAAPAAPVD